MNDKNKNVIKYILREYPYKSELSASRLTKILYLVDWKSALMNDRQVTDANWLFNHYGPYVDDFMEIANYDDEIEVKADTTMFGGKKKLVMLKRGVNVHVKLSRDDEDLIMFVINATKTKNYEDFVKLVYSTYPVITGSRYSKLDLVTAAHDYKKLVARKNETAIKMQR